MENSITIAVVGKGGTGKTVVATILIGLLAKRFPGSVLAIDADSASSLPYTLEMDVERTVSRLRSDVAGSRDIQDEYRHVSSKDMMRTLLAKGDGFDLMVLGRPEGAGCYCAVNDLLKLGITLLSGDYRVTIIDGEAGPEQLNRRVVSKVDLLLVMCDMSIRSLRTAKEIMNVATSEHGEGVNVAQAGIILNRVRGDEPEYKALANTGLRVLAQLPEDPCINQYDREGRALLDLPQDCPSRQEIERMLREIIPEY
ncbi:hypothetical protein [Adlercreutzia sp. ZJ138]|uniref:ATP-binding protein n=1 Tax=Adlercreutzia sp. ZJ138 TaxID=2709405 RepID=UPI0013EAB92B|nr:hypothetical protein [Adlercreutzia sp. ZJ138]